MDPVFLMRNIGCAFVPFLALIVIFISFAVVRGKATQRRVFSRR
jgi:hypothetical protein